MKPDSDLSPKIWTVKKGPEDCTSNFRDNFLYFNQIRNDDL